MADAKVTAVPLARADVCRSLVCARCPDFRTSGGVARRGELCGSCVVFLMMFREATPNASAGGAEVSGNAALCLEAAVSPEGGKDVIGHVHGLLAQQPVQRLPQRADVL